MNKVAIRLTLCAASAFLKVLLLLTVLIKLQGSFQLIDLTKVKNLEMHVGPFISH